MKFFTQILLLFLLLCIFLIVECVLEKSEQLQKSKSKANKSPSNADGTVPNGTNKKKANSNAKPEKQAKLEIVPVPATQPGLGSKFLSVVGRTASAVASTTGVGTAVRMVSDTVGSGIGGARRLGNGFLKTVGYGAEEKEGEPEKDSKNKKKLKVGIKPKPKTYRKEKSIKKTAENPDMKKLAAIPEGPRKKNIQPSPQNSPRKSAPNSPISPANKMAEKPVQKPREGPKIAFGSRVYDRKEESRPKVLDEINQENSRLLKVVKHVCVSKTAKYRDCQKLETRGICPLALGFIHALTPNCVELELVKETGKPDKYGYEHGHETVTCCKNKYAKKGKDWEMDNEKAEKNVKKVMEVLKIEALPQTHDYLKRGKGALASKPVLPLLNAPNRAHSIGGEAYGNPKNSIVENDSGLAQNDMNSPGMINSMKRGFRSLTGGLTNVFVKGRKYVQENPKKVAASALLLTTGAGFLANANNRAAPPVRVTGTQITHYGGAGEVRTLGARNDNFVGNKLALGPHDVQAFNGNSAQFAKHFGITEKGLKEVQNMEENKDFEPFQWGNNPENIPEWENTPDTILNKGSGDELKAIEKNYQDDKIEKNNDFDTYPKLNDDVDEAGKRDDEDGMGSVDTRDDGDGTDFNNPPGPSDDPSEDVNDAPHESSDLLGHENELGQDGGGNEDGLRGFEQLEHDDIGREGNEDYKETNNDVDEKVFADDEPIHSSDKNIQKALDTGKQYTED